MCLWMIRAIINFPHLSILQYLYTDYQTIADFFFIRIILNFILQFSLKALVQGYHNSQAQIDDILPKYYQV